MVKVTRFIVFLALLMVLPTLSVNTPVTSCPKLSVQDVDSIFLEDTSILRYNSSLLAITVSTVAMGGDSQDISLQYSSLGLTPVVTVYNYRDTHHVIAYWAQEDGVWTVSLDTVTDCGVQCEVLMELASVSGECGLLEWRGRFLVSAHVPLLQWIYMLVLDSPLTPSIANANLTQSLYARLQCYPQVSVVVRGTTLIITTNLFRDIVSIDICALTHLDSGICANLVVTDVLLTHSHLLLITSLGLLRSNITRGDLDLQELSFSIQDSQFIQHELLCCRVLTVLGEKVHITAHGSDGSVSVYTSQPPHTDWALQNTLCYSLAHSCNQLAVAYDLQRRSYITALTRTNSVVEVYVSGSTSNPVQTLTNFITSTIHFHTTSATVYLLGTQVWVSVDGGHSFNSILSLTPNDTILSYGFSDQSAVFLASSGELYFSRPGSSQIIQLTSLPNGVGVKVALVNAQGIRLIDICNETITSHPVTMDSSVKEIGPRALNYDVLNTHLVYLYGNQSAVLFALGHMTGFSAKETNLGAGVVVKTLDDRSALVLMQSPLQYAGNSLGEWTFGDYQCWAHLAARRGFDKITHELDVWDSIELQVEAISTATDPTIANLLPEHFLDVSVIVGDPELFDVLISTTRSSTKQIVTTKIWQRNTTIFPIQTAVTFQLVHCSVVCERCSLTVIVYTCCPINKHLQFVYPFTQSLEQLYQLPTNYRPPSSQGTLIYHSPHVYNVDPSSMTHTASLFSQIEAQLKQCRNKHSRAECMCSFQQQNTTDVSFSDCIQKVYRHLYEVGFPLTFDLVLGNGSVITIDQAIDIEEVNDRTDYSVRSNSSMLTTNQHILIRFEGPGLYHFRATLINVSSFCQLQTQFTVYVDRTPLPRTGEITVTTVTTILFGLATFFVYLFQHFKMKHTTN